MASVKYNGKWVESTSLPMEVLIELGLVSEIKSTLDKVPESQKKSPVKKEKGKSKNKGV